MLGVQRQLARERNAIIGVVDDERWGDDDDEVSRRMPACF
jgi:hypothetical protein